MTPYNRKRKVNDIESPISSNIHGKDILGINANIPALSRTTDDIQEESFNTDFMNKLK